MPDREKVIVGLAEISEHMRQVAEKSEDPMLRGMFDYWHEMAEGALTLLIEQEPLTIHDPGAICPNCKWLLYPEDHPNYCGNCGKAVKWE